MTWQELIQQLQGIPENRREEKAVFVVDGEDAWEIDAVNLTDEVVTVEEANEIMDRNSIWDSNRPDDVLPIIITP